jgi:hypothetical protein
MFKINCLLGSFTSNLVTSNVCCNEIICVGNTFSGSCLIYVFKFCKFYAWYSCIATLSYSSFLPVLLPYVLNSMSPININ